MPGEEDEAIPGNRHEEREQAHQSPNNVHLALERGGVDGEGLLEKRVRILECSTGEKYRGKVCREQVPEGTVKADQQLEGGGDVQWWAGRRRRKQHHPHALVGHWLCPPRRSQSPARGMKDTARCPGSRAARHQVMHGYCETLVTLTLSLLWYTLEARVRPSQPVGQEGQPGRPSQHAGLGNQHLQEGARVNCIVSRKAPRTGVG